MTMFLAPYTAIADIDGSPLDAGFIFFGEFGKNPESFPIPIYWDADFTIPAAQPIRTRNGYPIRNGSPCKIYLKQAEHSLVIKNKNLSAILVEMNNKGISSSLLVRPNGDTVETSLTNIDAELNNKQQQIDEKPSQQYVDEKLDLKAPQETTYTKLEVDSALSAKAPQETTYTKTEVDTVLSNLSTTANKYYSTLAAANADIANIALNQSVTIGEEANSGLWEKKTSGATTLTKSPYDPLTQAKTYFDSSITTVNNVELYSTANNVVNINIDPANGSIRAVGSTVNIFPIVAGVTYTLSAVGFNTTYAILAVSPNNSTAIGKTQTLQPLTNTADPNVKTFVAPITGFAFLNVSWGTLNIVNTLSIKSSANNGVESIKGVPIHDPRVNGVDLQTVLNESDVVVSYPNLYEVAPKTANMYVGEKTLSTTADGALVGFPIEINKTYLIKAPAFMSPSIRIVGLSEAGQAINGKAVTKRDLLPTSEADIYQFSTTSADSAFTQAFFTTKLPSQSYDVRDTTSIYEGFVSQDLTPYISKLNGVRIAKPQNPRIVSRFEKQKVWAAGDSITQGTTYTDENGIVIPSNTYVEYLAKAFGTYINNHGSSGARVNRVVDIITAGSGIAQRDTPTAWGVKDPTNLACFTLMVGTNDASQGLISGSIDELPNGKFEDYATADEYAALFPNNYLCNIALLIEYIRWKSPKCEIHIIAPPYRNRPSPNSDLPSKMTSVLPYLEAVCRHYGVHLIYAIYECGIGYKEMSPLPNKTYSYDGVHFTKLGNEVFGKFVAQKVLSFG